MQRLFYATSAFMECKISRYFTTNLSQTPPLILIGPERTSPGIDINNVVSVDGAFNTTVFRGGNTTLQCTVTTEVMPEISVSRLC